MKNDVDAFVNVFESIIVFASMIAFSIRSNENDWAANHALNRPNKRGLVLSASVLGGRWWMKRRSELKKLPLILFLRALIRALFNVCALSGAAIVNCVLIVRKCVIREAQKS